MTHEEELALRERLCIAEDALEQVDDVLVVNWVEVRDNNYRTALHDLVTWNVELDQYCRDHNLGPVVEMPFD